MIDQNEESNLSTLRIECFRHANSVANCGETTFGIDPGLISLSAEGEVQAHAMAASHVASPDMILSSPMVRAMRTALPTCQRFPDVPFRVWEGLAELTLLAPGRFATGSTVEMRRPFVDEYWLMADPGYIDGPGAESFSNIIDRVDSSIRSLSMLAEQRHVIVFGHGIHFLALRQRIERPDDRVDQIYMRAFRQRLLSAPIANGFAFTVFGDTRSLRVDPGCNR